MIPTKFLAFYTEMHVFSLGGGAVARTSVNYFLHPIYIYMYISFKHDALHMILDWNKQLRELDAATVPAVEDPTIRNAWCRIT
jgi:shikimate kinase